MTDPKTQILDLLETNWTDDVLPTFSTGWYDAKSEDPQVTVSHESTNPSPTGLSDLLGDEPRRFEAVYAVDVWVRGDQDLRYRHMKEVDRILWKHCQAPGGNLEHIEPGTWTDLDEPNAHPRLLRSRVLARVLYYE